jgi:DNA polymerase-3 subunit epsilon
MSTNLRLTQTTNCVTLLRIEKREFAPLLKIFPKGVIAIDLETTGLSPLVDKIIEVAAIKVTPEGVETFQSLIKPGVPIPAFTTDIHGITDEDVKNSPSLLEIMPKLLTFMGNLPLIAHNAKFDAGFIVFSLHQSNLDNKSNDVYCSIKASRLAFPEMPNHKLATLSQELEIPLENHHRATDDALASMMIFNKAAVKYERAPHRLLKQALLFNLSSFKKSSLAELPEKAKILLKKTQRQTLVDIKYKGGSHKGKFRPVKPVSLLPMPEGSILYGLCLLSNLYKSFALKKIDAIKELSAEEIRDRFQALKELEQEKP